MDSEVHDRLITTLLEIPGMDDSTVRTSLLTNIPIHHSLTRHNDPHADVSLIVSELARIHFSDGMWGLLIFIDRALSRVSGTTLSDQLQELRRILVAEQSIKDKVQHATQCETGEVVLEKAEKKENPPEEAHDVMLQEVQAYHSEVSNAQQLLSKALVSLKIVYKLFKEGRDIRQDQCDKAILHMGSLNTPLLKIRELCENMPPLPGTFPISIYQFKVKLNDIDDQIDELNSPLLAFRDSCPVLLVVVQAHRADNEREQVEDDRKKITEQLDSLLKALQEIENLLNKFLQALPKN